MPKKIEFLFLKKFKHASRAKNSSVKILEDSREIMLSYIRLEYYVTSYNKICLGNSDIISFV